MILISIFAVSLIGVIAMISIKVFEIKQHRKTWLFVYLSRFDGELSVQVKNLSQRFDLLDEQAVLFFKEKLPRQVKYFFLLLKKNMKEKYENILPNIRGSRILRKDGNVSAFLRDISKHKEENGGGRIDDEIDNESMTNNK
jgi:hypothetical protein